MTQHTSELEREWRSEITTAQLSQRAQLFLDAPDRIAAIERWGNPAPSPADLLVQWLAADAAAVVAAASVAGEGALTIADEKLSKLEQLVELVRAQERRLVAAETDVILLAEMVRDGHLGDLDDDLDDPGPGQ
jgi:hypothetical protein